MTNTIDSGSHPQDIPRFNRRLSHPCLTGDTGQGLIELALTLPLLILILMGGAEFARFAWAAIETAHLDQASPLTRLYPIPLAAGDPLLSSQIFPRFLYLRATVLKSQGKAEEADHNLHLFHAYTTK